MFHDTQCKRHRRRRNRDIELQTARVACGGGLGQYCVTVLVVWCRLFDPRLGETVLLAVLVADRVGVHGLHVCVVVVSRVRTARVRAMVFRIMLVGNAMPHRDRRQGQ